METKCCDQILELLAKSEARIDRTNEMLCKFAESALTISRATEKNVEQIKSIADEYTKHIDRLQNQRDELTRQNGELIRQHAIFIEMLSHQHHTTINNN